MPHTDGADGRTRDQSAAAAPTSTMEVEFGNHQTKSSSANSSSIFDGISFDDANLTPTLSRNCIVQDAIANPRGTARELLSSVVSDSVAKDTENTIPTERLHGLVDALFPIVATVLFAKNFSEIGEEEADEMIEMCETEDISLLGAPKEGNNGLCTWEEVAKLMWVGMHEQERFHRLLSTSIVFALVYTDWLSNVRIYRKVKHISKMAMVAQMLWCIGATIYPLSLSPWMMGWKQPLAIYIALGQLAFCHCMHLVISLLLPILPSAKRMLVAEDALMVCGIGAIALVTYLTDSSTHGPTYYWALIVALNAARVIMKRKLDHKEDWTALSWAVDLGRLEFFTDGVFVITMCLVLVEM